MMFFKRFAAATAVVLSSSLGAHAATIEITSIVGFWQDVSPSNTVELSPETAPGSNNYGSSVSWGTPTTAGGGRQSGYDFDAVASPFKPDTNPFAIGTFTHRNYAIASRPRPSSIAAASLNVTVEGNLGGEVFSLNGIYDFTHIETVNYPTGGCSRGGEKPCPDLVTFHGLSSQTPAMFSYGGDDFVFELIGFEGGSSFLTKEGDASTDTLLARFTSDTGQVPIIPTPAAGLLMMSAFGALGFTARRRRKLKA